MRKFYILIACLAATPANAAILQIYGTISDPTNLQIIGHSIADPEATTFDQDAYDVLTLTFWVQDSHGNTNGGAGLEFGIFADSSVGTAPWHYRALDDQYATLTVTNDFRFIEIDQYEHGRGYVGVGYSLDIELPDGLSFSPQISSVPEASTWTMMILGFLGIGAVTYHRRKSAIIIS